MKRNRLLNTFLLISFFIALILTLWGYHLVNNQIGDIKFDSKKDKSSFEICDKGKIYQYYSVETHYTGERKAIRAEIFNYLKSNLIKDKKSGYITFRFIVNCKGETGWFRFKTIDENFKEVTFSKEAIRKLESAIRKLRKWNPGILERVKVDSYAQINFKIVEGEIIDIF